MLRVTKKLSSSNSKKSICDEAELAAGERARLWERAILNPFCFEGWQ
jgi:hypothetical protein